MNDKPFSNGLNASQVELLDILAEELAEAIQVVSKIKRHGYESCHPDHPGSTNRELLERELGHVDLIVIELISRDELRYDAIKHFYRLKATVLPHWLHHTTLKTK